MGFFSDWSSSRRFKSLPQDQRRVVFYAESASDWPHLGPVLESLTADHGYTVPYLTSDSSDPVLNTDNSRIKPFCIGSGTIRTVLFTSLAADVLVMTLPELDKYSLKRSAFCNHYVYVFHSINSTHMVYRKGAFDAYDTILCVGQHHVDEIRATERAYNLKEKALVSHGYGRLDAILEKFAELPPFQPSQGPSKKVLLAPSWGLGSFIEDACGPEIIAALLEAGHELTARLHPMTVRHHPNLGGSLEKKFKGSQKGSFVVETDMHAQESLHRADIMISDWSGAAFEFAFGLGRPVLFIDMPRKLNNPDYKDIDNVPLEESIRHEIGDVASKDSVAEVAKKVAALCSDPAAFKEKILVARDKWIFNPGKSGKIGADAIAEIAGSISDEERLP